MIVPHSNLGKEFLKKFAKAPMTFTIHTSISIINPSKMVNRKIAILEIFIVEKLKNCCE
jgi:hypothetical protein